VIAQLVYASSAASLFRPEDLASILAASRSWNASHDVTGVLLYSDGNILQALEGPPAAVDVTFERVQADARHRGIMVIYRGSAAERSFPDWAMGLRTVEALPEGERDGVRSLFDLTEPGPTRAHRLLASFRAFVR
jgi:hypothetical protein